VTVGPQVMRALVACRKLDLDQDERHELSEFITGHEGSWSTMSEDDARRIADALYVFREIQWLYHQRRRQPLDPPARRSA
jgi:hypothetical protein